MLSSVIIFPHTVWVGLQNISDPRLSSERELFFGGKRKRLEWRSTCALYSAKIAAMLFTETGFPGVEFLGVVATFVHDAYTATHYIWKF